MANEWFYQLNGKQLGPVDQETLGVLAKSGAIVHATPVWHEGLAEWQPAAKIPGLFTTPPPVMTGAPAAEAAHSPAKRPPPKPVRREHEPAGDKRAPAHGTHAHGGHTHGGQAHGTHTHGGIARHTAPAAKPMSPALLYGGGGAAVLFLVIGVFAMSGGKTPANPAAKPATVTKPAAAPNPPVTALPSAAQLAQQKRTEQAQLLKEFDERYRNKSASMAELGAKLDALEKKYDDEMWQADIQARQKTLRRDFEELASELVETLGKAGLKKAEASDVKGGLAELDKIPAELQRTLAALRITYYRKLIEEKALQHFKTADANAFKLQQESRFADALRAYDAVGQFGMAEIERQLQLRRAEIADAEKRGLQPSRDAKQTLGPHKQYFTADLYWGLDGMPARFDAALKDAILEDPDRAAQTADLKAFPRSALFHYVHALVGARHGDEKLIRWHMEHAARLAVMNDAFKSRLVCVEARLLMNRPLTLEALAAVYKKCQEAWVLDNNNADVYYMSGVYYHVEALFQTTRAAQEESRRKAKEQFGVAAKFDLIFAALASEPDKYKYAGTGGNPHLQSVLLISGTKGGGEGFGTGFAVKSDGTRAYVITNQHVIAGLNGLKAVYQFEAAGKVMRRESTKLKILQVDTVNDLALLEVETESPIKPLPLRRTTEGLVVPMKLTVIGHPKGLDYTVVSAELSNASRELDGRRYLQLSGNIDAGNSGGPVIDEKGFVLGVTVAKIDAAGQALAILTEHVRDLCAKCGVTVELK